MKETDARDGLKGVKRGATTANSADHMKQGCGIPGRALAYGRQSRKEVRMEKA